MALNIDGVRFQAFKNTEFLRAMSITQLKNYLKQEESDIEELKVSIKTVKTQIEKTSLGETKLETTKFETSSEKEALIAQIQAMRAVKVNLASTLKSLKESVKQIKKGARSDYNAPREGAGAHEAYSRVMESLTHDAEELRETWDSDDVITIDDIAIQEGISYDEALAQFRYKRSQTTAYDRGTPLEEDE